MIKVPWDVEELVAIIDVYKNSDGLTEKQINDNLARLSIALNHRADKLGIYHDEKFRNINGVKMIFQNIVYVATNGEKGLSAASESLKAVYELSNNNSFVFKLLLDEFNSRYSESVLE